MDKHIISAGNTLIEALGKLNQLSGQTMTLFVQDEDCRIVGTLTDGDIRRALIGGGMLDTSVGKVMHTTFRAIRGGVPDVALIRRYRDEGIRLVPWLDAEGRLARIIDLSANQSILPLSAVIMAGGKGERLRPLTLETPKPLLKIGGKCIIDYNVEALARCGITDITVTTRYLAGQIHEHFSQPIGGVTVKCVEEDLPLGTVGAAALASLPADGNTIVMNSDLLTTISFEDMYLHHIAMDADITIAAIPYQVSVPYAILTPDRDNPEQVSGLEEKPSYAYYANAGIYIMPNNLLRRLPADRRTDATDLIEQAIAQGLKVVQFPLNGTWIDIGSPTDFRQATELIKYVQKASTIR